MPMIALRQQITDCLPIDEATGRPISFAALCRRIGIAANTLYRRIWAPPWKRNRGAHNESELFDALAQQLGDTKSKLLWLGGYNPWVDSNLSRDQLYALYAICAKAVAAMRGSGMTPARGTLVDRVLREMAQEQKEVSGG